MKSVFQNIRLGVTGGRNYDDVLHITAALNTVHSQHGIGTLIEGGCPTGLDIIARTWAVARGIPVETHDADWDKHGKAAGPIRNSEMAEVIDALAAFPGGRGTADMRRKVHKKGLPIYDF